MKRVVRVVSLSVLYALMLPVTEEAAFAQALVIQGGTLIDGNGDEPVQDALIIIEGERFRTVTTAGKAQIPTGAKVISAEGKYILPGFVDSHYHLADWHFELALAAGITTIVDTGNVAEWTIAQKEGVAKGKIRGPRIFASNALPNDPALSDRVTGKRGIWGTELLASPESEENLAMVRDWIRLGIDVLKFHPVSLDVVRVMAGEARRRGIPTMCHCQDLRVMESVPAGIQKLAHGTGVVPAIIDNPAKWAEVQKERNGDEGNTWDWFYADPKMYGKRIDEVIQFLIENNVYVEPTFESEWKGLYPESQEFVAYDMWFLHNNPALLTYIPASSVFKFGRYTTGLEKNAARLERKRRAYRHFQYFIRRFVELGGKLHVSSDQTHDSIAGIALHNEMILTHAAGLTPMQVIVAATRNPAEWLGKLKDLGTIEPGKLADMIVATRDPLADIRNLKGSVETVIIGGKVMDISFHSDYHNPIPSIHQTLKYSSETPELDPKIVPRVVAEGSDTVTVTINGRYLSARTQAFFKGVAVPTRVKGRTSMEITIPAELLSEVGAWPITAIDNLEYGPAGSGGLSKPVFLWVKYQ